MVSINAQIINKYERVSLVIVRARILLPLANFSQSSMYNCIQIVKFHLTKNICDLFFVQLSTCVLCIDRADEFLKSLK